LSAPGFARASAGDHQRAHPEPGDRRDIAERIERNLRLDSDVGGERGRVDHQVVAVRRRLGDEACAEQPAGPGAVVDQDRLAHRLAQALADDAAEDVVAAARGERNDETQRTIRVGLRRLGERDAGRCRNG